MSSFESGARGLSASAGIAILWMVACGGPTETHFYDSFPAASAARGGAGNTASSGGSASGPERAGGGSGGAAPNGGGSAGSGTGAGGDPGQGGRGTGGTPGAGETSSAGDTNAGAAGDGAAEGGAAGAPSVDCSARGESAVAFGGHCYAYHPSVATWQDAVTTCRADGAHLVTISSEGRDAAAFLAENAFVWQLGLSAPAWLGATDGKAPNQPGDGTFYTWITGEAMTLDNWSGGQPNNAQSSCQENVSCSCDRGNCYEHCAFQWETAGREMDAVPGWNDRLCDHVLPYVCEWDEP